MTLTLILVHLKCNGHVVVSLIELCSCALSMYVTDLAFNLTSVAAHEHFMLTMNTSPPCGRDFIIFLFTHVRATEVMVLGSK